MPIESESKSAARVSGVWPEQIPELVKMPMPDRLRVPIGPKGAGAANVKSPGTNVHRGEPLVDHAAESTHIPLAPADGTVGDVRPIRLTTGGHAVAVELIVSGESSEEPKGVEPSSDEVVSLVDALEKIRSAGIWADRHISPDLIEQLNQVISRPIDTLICTILDSDASLRLNSMLTARYAERVVLGITMLARATSAHRVILGVESFTPASWIKPLWAAADREEFEIVDLANDYPQSDPTLMIYSLAHRRLQPGNLPPLRGVVVLDAAAALAIGNGVCGEPMLRVPLAVHDHVRRHSHFLSVPVGTTIEQVLKYLSIQAESVVRGGDLLRDVTLRMDAVIAGGELTIHVTAPEEQIIPEPCIRCAWCFEACPTLIHPAFILDAAQRQDMKMAERAGIGACIECGVCAHVCPSRLPLLRAIRDVRNENFE